MKKIICVFLCALMLFSTTSIAFAAEKEDFGKYPLILVPGYSSTRLIYTDENGEKQYAWKGLDFSIGSFLLNDIVRIGKGIGELAQGDAEYIGRVAGENVLECYEKIRVDKNGKSVYPLEVELDEPEECIASVLGEEQYEGEIAAHLAQYIDGGLDNVFNFTSDFRMGAIECAARLYSFVEKVLEYTGAEKVNIFAVSHGGQVTGTYLSLYCTEGQPHYGKVNSAVLTVPALGGAGFAYDVFKGDVELDLDGIMTFVEYGEMMEEDYHWLLQTQALGFLDDIVNNLLPYVLELLGRWGSMWDFIPIEYYPQTRARLIESGFVSEEESADLLAASDRMHYEIMAKFEENFASCKTAGTRISIIAGSNNQIVTGLQDDSDAIITTKAATGATCAPLGQRFADGYVQIEDNGFYQLSPSMTIDASTCYLPENTWIIEGLYHGMTYKDRYVTELMTKLLLTDEIENVNSDPAFPQFHAATSNSLAVYAGFNSSKDGYVSSDDTKLVITNLSNKYDLKLVSIKVEGADFGFAGLASDVLKPGESLELEIIGEIPEVSLKNVDIIVDYVQLNSVTPLGERRFNFTVMNGPAVEFDTENPLVSASEENKAGDYIGEDTGEILETVGVMSFLEIIFNIVMPIVEKIMSLVENFKNIGA
ncbi:MAG: hypothetical protein IJ262_05235 [Clostridia bacterium]|nr:hypothetical protein [Clostridia bacterium]